MIGAFLLLLAASLSASASAPAIPGADSPAYSRALALWLADDEGPALQALSELARDDNRAAQILLGLIDKTPSLQGPWLAHMPRDTRIGLMRAPGGLSGRSWLAAAAAEPVAAAWLSLFSIDAGMPTVLRFIELGETRAAREAQVVLAAREHADLRQAAPDMMDPELLYLLWRTSDDARRATLLDLVPAGHPQRTMMGEEHDHAALLRWLESATAAMPLAALCDARCPESRANCLTAAYGALASHNAVLVLGSPVEALVSQADFLNSPRGQATVLRRILQSTDARGRGAMIARMRGHDECLADVLYTERARYYYRRPGLENGAAHGSADGQD